MIRLPKINLSELKNMILSWRLKKKWIKGLLSLIVSLSFACKVIPPGRIFPRRLIGLSTSGVRLNQHIDIYSDARIDLAMLSEFLEL